MKREQSLTDNITIVTWNINGVGNKLENSLCKNLILDKDIICLNEIKTAHTFSCRDSILTQAAERIGTEVDALS